MPPPPLSGKYRDARRPPIDPTHLSFKGKTVLVTGATNGIGLQAAIKYAELGASTLILGVRSVEKGEKTKAEILRRVRGKSSPSPSPEPTPVETEIIIKPVDLSKFASVKGFVKDVSESVEQLHVVQLCAGIMTPSFRLGAEGYEAAFQVNVLSTALMALLLLPKVRETALTGSDDGYMPHISFLNDSSLSEDALGKWVPADQTLAQRINDASRFDHVAQYYLVKLAARYFVQGLAAHCKEASPRGETNIIVNCSCPAMCRGTALHREYPWYVRSFMLAPYKAFCGRKPEHGSRSLVSAAGLGLESHGKLWINDTLPE
jgi:NAD(P)-dependent dehydrogenase (short-subunit alcohol dehydrogenase family)